MASIYAKGNKLYASIKNAANKWVNVATGFNVGQERQAEKFARDLEARRDAGLQHGEAEHGPVTLRRYVKTWNAEREKLGLADTANTKARLERHVLPVIGDYQIVDIRARHVVELIKQLRTSGKLAPKTIYNVYANLKAVFRDAQIADLIDASPCVLTKYQLGENVDKDPEWRATALFSRDELERLISDPRVPLDRRVQYALEGIAALRLGEAVGLRWRHYDATKEPLGQLLVATSYDKGRTKTKLARRMPVHATLAAVLAEWKMHGWPAMMGRVPTADDLLVPLPPEHAERRRKERASEGMRSKTYAFKRLRDDLLMLKLRHRRGHDLRRTMISLARTDGARKDILELCTHTPRKGGAIDLYTTFPWEALCEEVAKLKVRRQTSHGDVVPLRAMAASEQNQPVAPAAFYRFSTAERNEMNSQGKSGGGAGSRTRVRKCCRAAPTCVSDVLGLAPGHAHRKALPGASSSCVFAPRAISPRASLGR
jgi:integrase